MTFLLGKGGRHGIALLFHTCIGLGLVGLFASVMSASTAEIKVSTARLIATVLRESRTRVRTRNGSGRRTRRAISARIATLLRLSGRGQHHVQSNERGHGIVKIPQGPSRRADHPRAGNGTGLSLTRFNDGRTWPPMASFWQQPGRLGMSACSNARLSFVVPYGQGAVAATAPARAWPAAIATQCIVPAATKAQLQLGVCAVGS